MTKEIVGFILADGCCMIIKQKRRRAYKDKVYKFIGYIPKITVSQRADNLKVLRWFQKKLGGYVMANTSFKPPHHPVYYWQITTFEGCEKLAKMVMRAKIPHKKKKAAKILYKFCRFRRKQGKGKIGEEGLKKMEEFYQQIKKANSYSMEQQN